MVKNKIPHLTYQCLSLDQAEQISREMRNKKWFVHPIFKDEDYWIVRAELRTKPVKY